MGRTVPSFRIAEAQEVGEWKAFRRALPKRERPVFDEMLSAARLYTSASSAALRTSKFEGMAMAIVFHHQRLLAECTSSLADRRRPGIGERAGLKGRVAATQARTEVRAARLFPPRAREMARLRPWPE